MKDRRLLLLKDGDQELINFMDVHRSKDVHILDNVFGVEPPVTRAIVSVVRQKFTKVQGDRIHGILYQGVRTTIQLEGIIKGREPLSKMVA